MLSVAVHSAPGFEDYTFHFVNALSKVARVAYMIDAREKIRFGDALDRSITPIIFNRPRRRHLWGFLEMVEASKVIRQFQPDIFHLQGNGLWENILLRLVREVPLINTVHDPVLHIDYQNLINNFFLRDAVKKAQGWVVHSEGLKKVLSDQYAVKENKILVHPHGILDYYCRFASTKYQREKTILFFGEPRINKGFDLLIKVFQSIKDDLEGWTLILAGKGPVRGDIRASIQNLGDRTVYMNRHIPDAEVADLFSRAGIVVLPYRHGSQSGVLGIAAAFGCPVLATPVGNMAEIMENRKHVLFVEPDNDQALEEGLLSLAVDAELRAKLGNNLREHARSQWSWEKIAKATVGFYDRILQDSTSQIW